VNALLMRLVCGLLFAALVLGMVVHPPRDFTGGLGMLLPASMLLSVALKGPPRRSLIAKRRAPAPPPDVSGAP
jgi:hypothetical protein